MGFVRELWKAGGMRWGVLQEGRARGGARRGSAGGDGGRCEEVARGEGGRCEGGRSAAMQLGAGCERGALSALFRTFVRSLKP